MPDPARRYPDLTDLVHEGWRPIESAGVTRVFSQPEGAYRVSVRWPREEPPARGWPLLVLLDDEFADLAWALWRHHAEGRRGPTIRPGVVVAVGYPGASRRERDYVPALSQGDAGRAAAFRELLLDTVLPEVTAAWPIEAGARTLVGHSLGGLFVLDTLMRAPEAFTHWVAVSPSVWWGDAYLMRTANVVGARLRVAPGSSVQLFVGEHEQGLAPAETRLPPAEQQRIAEHRGARRMVDGARELAQALAGVDGLQATFTCVPGEGHRSVVPRALDLALRAVYAR